MRSVLFIISIVLPLSLLPQTNDTPIGSWREHLPYNSAIDLAIGPDKVYCATPYSIFTVSKSDESIERLSKVTGLSETGINRIFFDAANDKLLIAYANSNIDFLYRNDIVNVPDVMRSTTAGDKSIYDVYARNGMYYLSTGIGIIVVNGERYEIADTWYIGVGGSAIRVSGITDDGSQFYAASSEGLKSAPINSANLADYHNWSLAASMPAGACQDVLYVNGNLIALKDDALYKITGASAQVWYQDGWPVVSADASEGVVSICERKPNGDSRVVVLNADGTVARILTRPTVISSPKRSKVSGGVTWVADEFGSLSSFDPSGFEQYRLNSPQATASGDMTVVDKVLYSTAGEVNDAWNYQFNGNGLYILKDGLWNNINRYRYPALDTMLDFITVAIDPSDRSEWVGSYGGGLLHVMNDASFQIFKQGRLGAAIGDPSSYRVAGLAFDGSGNLWIANYGSSQPLRVLTPAGSWVALSTPFTVVENALTQILIDDNNYKWIVAAKGGGLICFDDAGTIDNIGDDRWRRYGSGVGNGHLPDGEVICIAKDRNGFIWAGTSNGIGIFQCAQEVFDAGSCDAIWPVVSDGSFAGYLFNGEEVRSIAVDGADRKWVATKHGAWLISAAGDKVIYQLTEANSPLLSDDVKQIAIDGSSGEVYFATRNGICSFRSTATVADEQGSKVLVYPNPVPPTFTGTIGIRGLPENAIVKITELTGRLVYQMRALGGQAVWDGRDYKGRKISTGIYLVLVTDDSRQEKKAGRIVFIGK